MVFSMDEDGPGCMGPSMNANEPRSMGPAMDEGMPGPMGLSMGEDLAATPVECDLHVEALRRILARVVGAADTSPVENDLCRGKKELRLTASCGVIERSNQSPQRRCRPGQQPEEQ